MWRNLLSYFLIVVPVSLILANECPVFQKPFPYPTPSPINANTKTATVVNATSPLVLTLSLFNLVNFTNTGRSIEIIPNQKREHSHITGGVLCNDIYDFFKLRYYINQNGGRSANAVNGIGSAFEMDAMFYNRKYKSSDNAIKHRDGLVIVSRRVKISKFRTNLLFLPEQLILELGFLRKPGSFALPFAFILFSFAHSKTFSAAYTTLNGNMPEYIVYPGSYSDAQGGPEYDSAIYILTTPEAAYISEQQFKAFKNVIDSEGSPIQSAQPLAPRGLRPVLRVRGSIKQKFELF